MVSNRCPSAQTISSYVVALSAADGDTVQTYEYTVYGEPAASDPNHTNPFLFTGRRFDPETGLYHCRARAYNPYIGRFLQTDPIGYGDGMNWYAYCGNNPALCGDPSGCAPNGLPRYLYWEESGTMFEFIPGLTDDEYWDEAGFYCAWRGLSVDYAESILYVGGDQLWVQTTGALMDGQDEEITEWIASLTPGTHIGHRGKTRTLSPEEMAAVLAAATTEPPEPAEAEGEETSDSWGVPHWLGPALVGAGWPIDALKGSKLLGARHSGSSIASYLLRRALPRRMARPILGTTVVGGAAGRAVPYIGWALIVADVGHLLYRAITDPNMTPIQHDERSFFRHSMGSLK